MTPFPLKEKCVRYLRYNDLRRTSATSETKNQFQHIVVPRKNSSRIKFMRENVSSSKNSSPYQQPFNSSID